LCDPKVQVGFLADGTYLRTTEQCAMSAKPGGLLPSPPEEASCQAAMVIDKLLSARDFHVALLCIVLATVYLQLKHKPVAEVGACMYLYIPVIPVYI